MALPDDEVACATASYAHIFSDGWRVSQHPATHCPENMICLSSSYQELLNRCLL